MRTVGRSLFGAIVLVAAMGAIITPLSAQAKVEEQVVGPFESVGFVVSPKGVHFAASTMQGSRYVLVVDGVESPKFDAAPQPPVFSPDGAHYAYYGRQGVDNVFILDGKEIARAPGTPQQFTTGDSGLYFSPAGKHLFYIERDDKTGHTRCVIDGKPGPNGGVNGVPVFSPDESRYAYILKKYGPPQTYVMIVDGKEVPYAGDHLAFSGDGKSILSLVQTQGQGKDSLMVDGKPLLTVPGLGGGADRSGIEKFVVAPAGFRIASIVRKVNGPAMVYMNDKVLPGVEDERVLDFVFSPDGQRYAALCATHVNSQYVVVDGKKGQDYYMIHNLGFTPDSSKVFYTADITGAFHFLVVGDKESVRMKVIYDKPVVAAQGNRVGIVGSDEHFKNVAIVDGEAKPPRMASQTPGDALTFSVDGSHYGFIAGNTASGTPGLTMVVDGVDQAGAVVEEFMFARLKGLTQNWFFVISPDGKYVAYQGHRADNKGRGLWVNDKMIFPLMGGGISRLAFTPDSQHLVWVAVGKDETLYVDGVEVMHFNQSDLDKTPGAWGMGSDGVFQFLAAAGDSIKRYRVTPPADTSVATLLGKAGK
jgi:hypothetical protein